MGIKRIAFIAAAVLAVICITQIHAAWTCSYDFSAPSKIDACVTGPPPPRTRTAPSPPAHTTRSQAGSPTRKPFRT